ncbi:MAG: hypothetical protein V9G19_01885 [Tetrasphaera sp.]
MGNRDLETLRQQAVVEAATLEAAVVPEPDVACLHTWLTECPTSEAVAIAVARSRYRCGDQVAALVSCATSGGR